MASWSPPGSAEKESAALFGGPKAAFVSLGLNWALSVSSAFLCVGPRGQCMVRKFGGICFISGSGGNFSILFDNMLEKCNREIYQ